jgi:hypothetical protein
MKNRPRILPSDKKPENQAIAPQGGNDLQRMSKDQLLDQLACSPCAQRMIPANSTLEEYLRSVAAEKAPPRT